MNLSSGQAATQLVQELLKGPTGRLGNGVTTLAPPGTEVQVSVPVEFGVATVALNDAVAWTPGHRAPVARGPDRLDPQPDQPAGQDHRRRRTLLPDDPDVLPFANFSQFDPSVPGGALTDLYGMKDGKVQRIVGLDGASDIAAKPLKTSQLYRVQRRVVRGEPARDAGAIVTKDKDGDDVVAYAKLDATDKADTVKPTRGGPVLRPSYDNQDNLWIVDKAESGDPRVRVRNRDGDVSTVKTSFHGDTPVMLRMAPDGVRALMVMKSKTTGKNYVQTGTILSGNSGKQLCSGSSASSSCRSAASPTRPGTSRASWSSA